MITWTVMDTEIVTVDERGTIHISAPVVGIDMMEDGAGFIVSTEDKDLFLPANNYRGTDNVIREMTRLSMRIY